MKHQEETFNFNNREDIFTQSWMPEGNLKAILLIVHGLGEHSGRYMNVVNRFVPEGYGVYGIDHVGHGKSSGVRMYVNKFEEYIDPLEIYFSKIKKEHPDTPIFIVGHSMGGLIAAIYLLKHQSDFVGAILSGPAIKVSDEISGGLIIIGKILSILAPKVGLLGVEAGDICRDPKVVDAYLNDPLVHNGKTTARLAAELLKKMGHLENHGKEINLPIMIVQGGEDKLVDPDGAEYLYNLVSSSDKKVIVYEDFYHEVFNEPDHQRVLNDVGDWLAAHLSD